MSQTPHFRVIAALAALIFALSLDSSDFGLMHAQAAPAPAPAAPAAVVAPPPAAPGKTADESPIVLLRTSNPGGETQRRTLSLREFTVRCRTDIPILQQAKVEYAKL